jgi:putative two-component system response regulator
MRKKKNICIYFSIDKFCACNETLVDKEFSESICKVPTKYSHCVFYKTQDNYINHKQTSNIEEDKIKELSDTIIEIKAIYSEITKRITSAVEYRDTYTGNHIVRVGIYAASLARELNISEEFNKSINFASQFHDIGMIGVPDNILLKPDKLTESEFEIIKGHTRMGSSILNGTVFPVIKMAETIALQHHERWDGSGYPYGLKGEDIAIESRIVIICDQYDALSMKKPYKEPLSEEKILDILTIGDGRTMPNHFDPEVLEAFKRLLPKFCDISNKLL